MLIARDRLDGRVISLVMGIEFVAHPTNENVLSRATLPPTGFTSMVSTKPITKNAANFVSHRLQQPRNGLLKLQPSRQLLAFCLVSVLVGAGVIAFALTVRQGPWLDGISLALGGVFVVLGLVLPFTNLRFEFDRDFSEFSEFRCRRWLFSRTQAMADIVAVQLIDGGLHKLPTQRGHSIEFRSYELNLVLVGSDFPRVNLTNHADLEVTRQVAVQLAEFLGVPCYDEMQNPQPKTAEGPNLNELFAAG